MERYPGLLAPMRCYERVRHLVYRCKHCSENIPGTSRTAASSRPTRPWRGRSKCHPHTKVALHQAVLDICCFPSAVAKVNLGPVGQLHPHERLGYDAATAKPPVHQSKHARRFPSRTNRASSDQLLALWRRSTWDRSGRSIPATNSAMDWPQQMPPT